MYSLNSKTNAKNNGINIKQITSFPDEDILGLLGFNIWHCLSPKILLFRCLGMVRKVQDTLLTYLECPLHEVRDHVLLVPFGIARYLSQGLADSSVH